MRNADMTRDEKIAEAHRLRAQGLTYREISVKLGYAASSNPAWRFLHHEEFLARERARNASKREWEKHNRASCPDCGESMAGGSRSPSHRPARCAACHRKAEAERVDTRAEQIIAWWSQGCSRREIATRLGWSENHLGVEMNRLRRKGYQMPYRDAGRKPRFPAQI